MTKKEDHFIRFLSYPFFSRNSVSGSVTTSMLGLASVVAAIPVVTKVRREFGADIEIGMIPLAGFWNDRAD